MFDSLTMGAGTWNNIKLDKLELDNFVINNNNNNKVGPHPSATNRNTLPQNHVPAELIMAKQHLCKQVHRTRFV
jgi:hypothetical protein